VFLHHIDPIFFLPLVTHLHALILLHIPCIPIGLGLYLVALLGPAVMSVVQVFPSYMMLSLACVFVTVFGLPSLMMWFVMLESVKDRILGVDTPRQHVSPRVWYGMAC
jgi:hypothetical protein